MYSNSRYLSAAALQEYFGFEEDGRLSNDTNVKIGRQYKIKENFLRVVKPSRVCEENMKNHNVINFAKAKKERLDSMKKNMTAMPLFSGKRMIKGTLGFREASNLVKISKETNCEITLVSENGKKGSSNSIFSLASLGLKYGQIVQVTLRNGDVHKAFNKTAEVLDGLSYVG